jgi:hypothetical protein
MAAILDPDELRATTASHLRLAGALGVLEGDRFAIAIGLGGDQMITKGTVTGVAGSSVSYSTSGGKPIRIDPDESVSAAAFDRGSDEVALNLVEALVDGFRSQR